MVQVVRVRLLPPDPRHVTLDTTVGGVDGTAGLAGAGAMASEALGFVGGGPLLGIPMRVMAGDAVEFPSTGGVTSALLQPIVLEPEPARVVFTTHECLWSGQAVTSSAHLVDRRSVLSTGIDDRQVGKLSLHRENVMTSGPVAALAANRMVGRLGSDFELDSAEIGGMATQTSPLPVA